VAPFVLPHIILSRKLLAANAAGISLVSQVALADVRDQVPFLAKALSAELTAERLLLGVGAYVVVELGEVGKFFITSVKMVAVVQALKQPEINLTLLLRKVEDQELLGTGHFHVRRPQQVVVKVLP